jgi:hypothetical protein
MIRSAILAITLTACITGLDVNAGAYGTLTAGRTVSDAAVAENTRTIQAALDDVGTRGGGTVLVPVGTWRVSAPNMNADWPSALLIRHNGVTLAGAGMTGSNRTTLVFHGMYRVDSTGQAFGRGHGIRFVGTGSNADPRRNCGIRDIELDGDGRDERDVGGYTGTGNIDWISEDGIKYGWDTGHKGIIVTANDCLDAISIERVDVHDFRGEVVYGGGFGLRRLTIRNSRIANSQADLMSLTADLICEDTVFDRTAMAYTENSLILANAAMVFRRCTFSRSDRHGVVLAQSPRTLPIPPGVSALIENCTFSSSPEGACLFGGNADVVIRDNRFTDVVKPLFVSADNLRCEFAFNTIRGVTTPCGIAILWAQQRDFYIHHNLLVNSSSLGRDGTCLIYSDDLSGIRFEHNTIARGRTPEQSSTLGTERPRIRRNVYDDCEDRHSTFYVNGTTVVPKGDQCWVWNATTSATVDASLATTQYVDGHELLVTGGTPTRKVRLPKASPNLVLAADILLDGSTSARFVFNGSDRKWHQQTTPQPLPTASITHPTTGSSLATGVAVSVSVNAVAGIGTVRRVELLVDNAVVATDSGDPRSGPYVLLWVPSVAGTRQLRARVTDSAGGVTVGAIVQVTIGGALPGDANGDGLVNRTDLSIVRGQFGRTGSAITPIGADTDGNGQVDATDLSRVVRNLTP